jgi:hypothetical protein
MRRYYGFEATYGLGVIGMNGERIGWYQAFESAAERDAWVEQGNPCVTQSGARKALRASDPQLRRLLLAGEIPFEREAN